MRHIARDDGFTLLEMLVVVTILGLLAAAAPRVFPSGGSILRASAQDVANDLRLLRDVAVRQGVDATLRPELGGYVLEPTGDHRRLKDGVTIVTAALTQNLLGSMPDQVTFYPDGSATGSVVTLRWSQLSIALVVRWLDGRVRVRG